MGDFPHQWTWLRDLDEGGQGHAYVVKRTENADDTEYVLKRLKNPKRDDYFEREILACEKLDHPNVLKIVEHGRTPKGKLYLITHFCEGGSLERHGPFDKAIDGLALFLQICSGVAHAHESGICHLDLKPANIFLDEHAAAVVGDFGICFIEDGEYVMTSDGPRGSIYYCAPELRGPKIDGQPALKTADVYSLGKILYWIFTGRVYDGHEEDYADDRNRRLIQLFPAQPHLAFVDDLISQMVRRKPAERTPDAIALAARVRSVLNRMEAGGRVLNLENPQRCLYCAEGHYRPIYDVVSTNQYSVRPRLPEIAQRRNPEDPSRFSPLQGNRPGLYEDLNNVAGPIIGMQRNRNAIPLLLVCDYCGNVQYFRLDLTKDGRGENWRP